MGRRHQDDRRQRGQEPVRSHAVKESGGLETVLEEKEQHTAEPPKRAPTKDLTRGKTSRVTNPVTQPEKEAGHTPVVHRAKRQKTIPR